MKKHTHHITRLLLLLSAVAVVLVLTACGKAELKVNYFVDGKKVAGNFLAHQIPLPLAKTDEKQLEILENWLKGYEFNELFDGEKFTI